MIGWSPSGASAPGDRRARCFVVHGDRLIGASNTSPFALLRADKISAGDNLTETQWFRIGPRLAQEVAPSQAVTSRILFPAPFLSYARKKELANQDRNG
jgi:hypothetical protein